MSDDSSSYKSPLKKLVAFFEKSRDGWKEKYFTSKTENKLLKNRISFLQKSQEKWREEALLLRRELKEHKTDSEVEQAVPIKKK